MIDRKLLLVDDDPAAITLFSRALDAWPSQRFALTGDDALRLAAEDPPDLVLLDADMPGLSGLQVLDRLRLDARLRDVPVIMATGHASAQLERDALSLGAVDFVRKPVDPGRLRARVRARLRGVPAPASAPQAADASLAHADAVPAMVLIVEDDPGAVELAAAALAGMAEVVAVPDAATALRAARARPPELLLVDVDLAAGRDGFSVCAELRSHRRLRGVPVVFVTRFGEAASEVRAFDLGAADYVAKPYDPATLRARCRNLIAAGRRTRDAARRAARGVGRLADARVAAMVQAASDGIVSVDGHGRVVLANAAACRLAGVVRAPVGEPLAALFAEGLPPLDGPAAPAVACTVRGAGGTSRDVEVAVFAQGRGAARVRTLLLRDLAPRQAAEAAERARREAEAARRSVRELTAYLAHEIGNPLNGLSGLVQLLHGDPDTAEPVRRRLDLMRRCTAQIGALLADLREVGRSERPTLGIRYEAVSAADVVADAAAAVQAAVERAGVRLDLDVPQPAPWVFADRDRLVQGLVNLLSNAVKYGQGEPVSLHVRRQPQGVRFAVADRGPGLTDSQMARLFVPHERLGHEGGPVPGSGLGLALTRRLVEDMGGTVQVARRDGGGSEFAITLAWVGLGRSAAPRERPAS